MIYSISYSSLSLVALALLLALAPRTEAFSEGYSADVDDDDLLSVSARGKKLYKFKRICLRQPALACTLQPTTNSTVSGQVFLQALFMKINPRRYRCVTQVVANVTGLSPGLHGFHIHSYGDIRTPDGKSTGGHFTNPKMTTDVQHGLPSSRPRHWGDLGNLNASANGTAYFYSLDQTINRLKFVNGRGIIVHALEDKGPEFQPTGAAGSRQAQCVIGIANPDLPFY